VVREKSSNVPILANPENYCRKTTPMTAKFVGVCGTAVVTLTWIRNERMELLGSNSSIFHQIGEQESMQRSIITIFVVEGNEALICHEEVYSLHEARRLIDRFTLEGSEQPDYASTTAERHDRIAPEWYLRTHSEYRFGRSIKRRVEISLCRNYFHTHGDSFTVKFQMCPHVPVSSSYSRVIGTNGIEGTRDSLTDPSYKGLLEHHRLRLKPSTLTQGSAETVAGPTILLREIQPMPTADGVRLESEPYWASEFLAV
jgi:hypothetical protein